MFFVYIWSSCAQAPALSCNPGVRKTFGCFPKFPKKFSCSKKPLGLSLLLPELSDQPNINKKHVAANFQSSEQLTVITAPGKMKTIPSIIFHRGGIFVESISAIIFPDFNIYLFLKTLF